MPRILVVDDDDGIRSFLKRKLVDEGHEVTVAENGAVASRQINCPIRLPGS